MFIRNNVNTSGLQKRSDLTLHLYADIGKIRALLYNNVQYLLVCVMIH